MKRVLIPFFSCLLVFTLLLGSFGSASAEVGDDPVVTPISGDMEFTTEVVPIASLPGTLVLANQMLAPVGFPEDEAQFEGAGVRVTGMESGKATACFTLSTIAVNQGWGGKVGVWNGTKWVLLPTTIATGTDEAANTSACAPITGNGTYAFIKWITDSSKIPTKGVCTYGISGAWGTASDAEIVGNFQIGYIDVFSIYSTTDLTGKTVTVSLTSSDPISGYVWFGTATGVLQSNSFGTYFMSVSPTVLYNWDVRQFNKPYWHLDFGNCVQDTSDNFST